MPQCRQRGPKYHCGAGIAEAWREGVVEREAGISIAIAMLLFAEHQLGVRHCPKSFTCVNVFKYH